MNEEKVSFVNRHGQTLDGVLHDLEAGTPRAGVILCHGMESNKESDKLALLSQELARCGLLALRFDFACAGQSGKFEEITYSGEVDDLQAAFAFMRDRQAGKIAILGSSMGGTVALLFAAKQAGVVTVVTIAAPVHPERFTSRLLTPAQVEEWRKTGHTFYHGQRINVSLLHDLEKLNVPAAARKISCPVLIMHGDGDDVVPVEEAHELYGYLSGPKKLSIFRGADHRLSDPALMDRALREAVEWLCQYAG
jgi:dipeptidyl aminopeptidase/acylaminoacyl peptidase